MKRVSLIAIVVAALGLWPLGATAQQSGRIDGQLVNGTAGAAPPAGAAVTVHQFKDRTRVGEQVVQTDQDGRFAIGNLEVGPGNVYFPIVEYGGASYFPDRPIEFETSSATTVIRVFEPTHSDAAIAFDRLNLLVTEIGPTTLTVMQMGAVVNSSDRTYLGDDGAGGRGTTLRFGLPRGATEIVPRAGLVAGDLTTTDDGFVSSTPIRPGRHELAFSYVLPYDARSLQIAYGQAYPTVALSLYVPDDGVTVSSEIFASRGTTELGGRSYQHYAAEQLPSGAVVAFTLSGLPAAFRLRPSDLSLLVIGAGLLVLGICLVAYLRRSRGASATGHGAPSLEVERRSLVHSLAELDERFEAGQLDEAAYRADRERRKADLMALSSARPVAEAR